MCLSFQFDITLSRLIPQNDDVTDIQLNHVSVLRQTFRLECAGKDIYFLRVVERKRKYILSTLKHRRQR